MSLILFLLVSMAQAAPLKIMPLGDSLTAGGYNLNKNEWHVGSGYRAKLKELLASHQIEIDFVGSMSHGFEGFIDREHEGYSGFRIEQIAEKFESTLLETKPDVVLLMTGSNDLFQNYETESAPARFFQIVQRIRTLRPDAVLFAASVISTNNGKFNRRIKAYNKQLKERALSLQRQDPRHFIWVEMADKTRFTNQDFTDGVHPTTPAYEKMGEVWAQSVRDFFKRQLAKP
jgi:acyl-CoA thioesterase I